MLTILQGDALEKLRELPDESVQCCVTSPPFWGLRDYGTARWDGGEGECEHSAPIESGVSANKGNSQTHPGRFLECKCGAKRIDAQLGLEKTPEEYVAKLVAVFKEVRRVLKSDGTLWLNLGDSYASSDGMKHQQPQRDNSGGLVNNRRDSRGEQSWTTGSTVSVEKRFGLKPKDLVGIPWMVAFALRVDGWWLRQDIIWSKPNPMPESVRDRCTKAHEYIFLLTKNARYFYDGEAIKEEAEYREDARPFGDAGGNRHGDEESVYDPRASWKGSAFHLGKTAEHQLGRSSKKRGEFNGKTNSLPGREAFRSFKILRNKRSVWTVTTQPYPEAHFATYPPDLIKPCILAGSRPGDTILDPFAGSGTTGEVALELGRKAVLIELNPSYCKLIERRCDVTPGLALAV